MKITPADPADLDRVGDKLVPVLAEQIGRVVRGVTRTWRAGHPPSVDDLAGIAPAWAQVVQDEIMPAVADAFWRGVNGIVDPLEEELTAAAPLLELPDEWTDPAVVEGAPLKARSVHVVKVPDTAALDYLAQASNRLVNVSNLIWEHARSALLDGMAKGEGTQALAARVAAVAPQLAMPRAEVIARTEVVGAANAGSFAQAQTVAPAGKKSWLTAGDDRVRRTHTEINGKTIGMNDAFDVGGAAMLRPHDPNGPASQTVNCRCVLTYDITPAAVPATPAAPAPGRVISGNSRFTDIPEAGAAATYDLTQPLGPLAFETNGFAAGDPRIRQILDFNQAVATRFGEPFDMVEQVRTQGTYAWVRNLQGSNRVILGLNPDMLNDRLWRSDVRSSWHPPGSGTFVDALVHEHGHKMLMTPRGLPYLKGAPPTDVVRKHTFAKQAAYKALVEAGGPSTVTELGKRISGYAQQSYDEMEAELWAWYHMGAAERFRIGGKWTTRDRRPAWVKAWGQTLLRELGLDTRELCIDMKLC